MIQKAVADMCWSILDAWADILCGSLKRKVGIWLTIKLDSNFVFCSILDSQFTIFAFISKRMKKKNGRCKRMLFFLSSRFCTVAKLNQIVCKSMWISMEKLYSYWYNPEPPVFVLRQNQYQNVAVGAYKNLFAIWYFCANQFNTHSNIF